MTIHKIVGVFVGITAALSPTQPKASPAREQLIIVDNRDVCGPARLAYHVRARAEWIAFRLARKIEREKGMATRVIVLSPGQYVGVDRPAGGAPVPIFINNPC